MKLTAEEVRAVKSRGFLFNRDREHFSGRILTRNGVMTSDELEAMARAARKYGNGTVALTTRLTAEVQGLTLETIDAFSSDIARAGLETGGTGRKVRPVVACKGTVCVFGLIDTQALGEEMHRRFYEGYADVTLPHKFKIAVGGCPNNCVKPDLNDFGVVGQRLRTFDAEKCRGCKKCAVGEVCPMGAASVDGGKLALDEKLCNNCARCADKCYFGAVKGGQVRYKVYVGGRWGKLTRHGTPLKTLFDREGVLDACEKALLLFKDQGRDGERFGMLVERLGGERVEELLLSEELLQRKDEILHGKPV